MRETVPLCLRLVEKIDRRGPDDCWPFTGGLSGGYGRIRMGGERKQLLAHRVMYELCVRKLNKREIVLHDCDNPACCNPKHLIAGTQKDNIQDCVKKGRHVPPRGEKQTGSNLTTEVVLEIRKLFDEGQNRRSLARRFSVNVNTIYRIGNRANWKHVKEINYEHSR